MDNILYNPHKKYDHNSFKYFERSFYRLCGLDSTAKDFKPPILLLTDYTNKDHYIYFKDTFKAATCLRYNCLVKYGYMPLVKIIRFELVTEDKFLNQSLMQIKTEHHIEYKVPISHDIDANTTTRRVFYKNLVGILR